MEPRYEYRAFCHHFGKAECRIRKLSAYTQYREGSEHYLLSRNLSSINIKIRDGLLDIKELIKTFQGLEQWYPVCKIPFPLKIDDVRDEIFKRLRLAPSQIKRDEISEAMLLDDIIRKHHELVTAYVFKKRFGYEIRGCTCELADVFVNGALVRSIALESTRPDDILELRHELNLDDYENVNYPRMLKGIVGLDPVPRDLSF
ncbi:MAG: hypothetical protein JW861_05745 [Bacteroidales bacterium]|nr:hypothetical protein [Bacteroidales bacterium]